MLVDSAIIQVRSGKGGDGALSFYRAKYLPKGGPDGGDGGDGGSVIMVVDDNTDTLLDFAGRHHWRAEHGQAGGGRQCYGKNGEDLIIRVPPGTQVFDNVTGDLIADLDKTGMKMVIAKGGRGGFGNEHFKSATHQTPRETTPGGPAEELELRLELKLVADIGLVGMPNAGKSTLIGKVSQARPKVADYPFTTLKPSLGIAELSGHRRVVIADIPGLIEGAHEGAGLGHRFLRHIERTKIIMHLVDVEPLDGSDPIENFQIIQDELCQYSELLAKKQVVIALSKMDLLPDLEDRAAAVELIGGELKNLGVEAPMIPVSSVTGDGLIDLLEVCWKRLEKDQKPGWSEPVERQAVIEDADEYDVDTLGKKSDDASDEAT